MNGNARRLLAQTETNDWGSDRLETVSSGCRAAAAAAGEREDGGREVALLFSHSSCFLFLFRLLLLGIKVMLETTLQRICGERERMRDVQCRKASWNPCCYRRRRRRRL
jgi:hypothetical protein